MPGWLFFTAGEVVHHGVESADITKDEIEEFHGDEALHQADEMFREGDSLVAGILFNGTQGLPGHLFGFLDAEEGADAIEHAGVDEVGAMVVTFTGLFSRSSSIPTDSDQPMAAHFDAA